MNRDSTPEIHGPSSPKNVESTSPPANEQRKDSADAAIEGSKEPQKKQTTSQSEAAPETKESRFFDNLDTLNKWINGHIYDPKLLEKQPFTLEELQAGLHGGFALISDSLDMEMRAVVDTASDRYHNIDIEFDDMYKTRDPAWTYSIANYLYHWDVTTLKKWLLGAKREITWMRNEMRRLEVHLDNAEKLIKEGLRRRFTYVPSPREWMEDK